jgi:hypothetical protein
MNDDVPSESQDGRFAAEQVPESYLSPLIALVLLILTLFATLIVANTAAAARLVALVLRGTPKGETPPTVTQLLVVTGLVLATNIVTFGLLYWQIDGGGPGGRVVHAKAYPDFQFPQTLTEGLGPPGWQPRFQDHLYLAFTNVVAFSPTDTLP